MQQTITAKKPSFFDMAVLGKTEGKELVPAGHSFAMQPIRLMKSGSGKISLNGKEVSIPEEITRVTCEALKKILNIYKGLSVYVTQDGRSRRVKDRDVVEILPDVEVKSVDERPKYDYSYSSSGHASSRPSFALD